MTTGISSHFLYNLRPSDTMREGRVVYLNSVSRIFFAIKEILLGGWTQRDQGAFCEFYAFTAEKIETLKGNLTTGNHLDEALTELQKLLKVAGKIANSSWAKSLNNGQSEAYAAFQKDLSDLQALAVPHLKDWIVQAQSHLDAVDRKIIGRWIEANDAQRQFAVFKDLKEVPYKFSEIPAGSVLITDPEAYLLNRHLVGKKSIWKTVVLRVKAFICWFFTGMRFTHAELALSNGETFDLDKQKGSWIFKGEAVIQKREDKVFYGPVVAPRKEAMLTAYNERFPHHQVATFEELWIKIEEEARKSAPKIKIGFWDIFKTGISLPRNKNYDCTRAWNPGVNRFSCSATISSLFSKFGIDVGQEFSKIDKNITPVDYLNSRFFEPIYVIP